MKTIKTAFDCSGVGLHSGVTTQVRVLPGTGEEGRYFVRVDLPGQPTIPATVEAVRQTTLSTELGQGEATVRTVEHLLAALAGHGVDVARIEVNGAELPLLDGSAKEWSEKIAQVGVIPLLNGVKRRETALIESPLWIRDRDAFVAALPASEMRFTYGIDFDLPVIGNQWYSWSPAQDKFESAIAPARTFGLAHQLESLRTAGLIKGGSLENALVCSEEGWLNPPLRFANEPVRHKLLDLVGDLSLLGHIPQAHFLAYKASHRLHIQLAQAIRSSIRQLGNSTNSSHVHSYEC